MLLESNTRYKATIKLSFMEAIASNEMITKKLTDVGFTDVTVSGTGASRQAAGTWSGSTNDVELPAKVTNVEKA